MAASGEPLLLLDGLTKEFRRRTTPWRSSVLRAVDDVSLRVERGDVFGFLGPNGAGKSTTLRMALGLIHPSAGRVAIGGHDLATRRLEALRLVGGYVESPAFYPYLTGRENLDIFARLSGPVAAGELDAALERVGLRGRDREPVRVYSHGMKARLGLAASLLPRPSLLVLDEPTDGLDPHGLREVRALIRALARDEGLTVFLSSHLLGEVENLCNRVAILERGRVILEGGLEALAQRHRRWRIVAEPAAAAEALLRARFGLEPLREADGGWLVDLRAHAPEAIAAALAGAGLAVKTLAPESGWLDRLFLELTTTKESSAAPPPPPPLPAKEG